MIYSVAGFFMQAKEPLLTSGLYALETASEDEVVELQRTK